jgi:hypothetical protein
MGALTSSFHCYIFIFDFFCIFLREKKYESENNPKMGYDTYEEQGNL